MAEFFYRTEDLRPEEVLTYYVDTPYDRQIVEALKGRNPVLLIGSRGVGKSFLLRVAEAQFLQNLKAEQILPVYVTFTQSTLIHTSDPNQFHHWMLARLASRIVRTLRKCGFLVQAPSSLSILTGGSDATDVSQPTRIDQIVTAFENSWLNPGGAVDITGLPDVDRFKEAIQDTCEELGVQRIAVFFDEAAHVFRPEQQRQFFSLFRDLRCLSLPPFVTQLIWEHKL
jgi:hypothetical protein